MSTPERTVWRIDGIGCSAGDRLIIKFESVAGGWRHGLWLGVEGELECNGVRAPQLTFWTDSAPPEVEVLVVSTEDGLLRLYNVWDSGRGLGMESQSATSGMLREDVQGGFRYRCNAIGRDPAFDSLVFTLLN